MRPDNKALPYQLAVAIQDATKRMGQWDPDYQNVEVWMQGWPSTACGFPEAGGATCVQAPVFHLWRGNTHLIYIDGRFAYKVEAKGEDLEDFLGKVKDHNLPGLGSVLHDAECVVKWKKGY